MATMIDESEQHIYIHWPFCKNKCHYCDFVAFEKHEAYINSYHAALCEEIRRYRTACSSSAQRRIKTIFFGGGTPSLYPLPLLKELFSLLRETFSFDDIEEISLEVNPGDIDENTIATWKALGINRLSVGVQILNDELLARLNRFQKCEDVYFLLTTAARYFENISADFIIGLPGVSKELWFESLTKALSFPLTHISTYILTIHEKTPLHFKIRKGEVTIPNDATLLMLYESTVQFLEEHGFHQYEISNFAKEMQFQSIHNTAYWNRKTYRGFGLGAASFDGVHRRVNYKNLTRYLEWYSDHSHKDCVFSFEETLTPEQHRLEEIMLGLRQKKGMSLHSMIYSLTNEEQVRFKTQLKLLEEHSLLKENDGTIILTPRGMALENEIINSLL